MSAVLNLLLVILLALNLRPILTSIGPLLEPMRASTGLGYQQAALLTALPVLCMGLVPLLQPWLRRWVSEHGGANRDRRHLTVRSTDPVRGRRRTRRGRPRSPAGS